MTFFEHEQQRFRLAWDAVQIARPVHYMLFTFGESTLPYFLVCAAQQPGGLVALRQGEVKIDRPLIVTPDNARPEFSNFFENQDEEDVVEFLLARTAAFTHLRFDNRPKGQQMVTDSIEETVSKLNRRLDDEEEDRVAILIAPPGLAGVAVLRYAAESVWRSAPENIQELRERGLLP